MPDPTYGDVHPDVMRAVHAHISLLREALKRGLLCTPKDVHAMTMVGAVHCSGSSDHDAPPKRAPVAVMSISDRVVCPRHRAQMLDGMMQQILLSMLHVLSAQGVSHPEEQRAALMDFATTNVIRLMLNPGHAEDLPLDAPLSPPPPPAPPETPEEPDKGPGAEP